MFSKLPQKKILFDTTWNTAFVTVLRWCYVIDELPYLKIIRYARYTGPDLKGLGRITNNEEKEKRIE